MTATHPIPLPIAPVTFTGIQDGMGVMPDFELWTFTEPFCGYPKGATISKNTLRELGFGTPPLFKTEDFPADPKNLIRVTQTTILP